MMTNGDLTFVINARASWVIAKLCQFLVWALNKLRDRGSLVARYDMDMRSAYAAAIHFGILDPRLVRPMRDTEPELAPGIDGKDLPS